MKQAKPIRSITGALVDGLELRAAAARSESLDTPHEIEALQSRLQRLEAENRELRRANEILRRTALHFAIPASHPK